MSCLLLLRLRTQDRHAPLRTAAKRFAAPPCASYRRRPSLADVSLALSGHYVQVLPSTHNGRPHQSGFAPHHTSRCGSHFVCRARSAFAALQRLRRTHSPRTAPASHTAFATQDASECSAMTLSLLLHRERFHRAFVRVVSPPPRRQEGGPCRRSACAAIGTERRAIPGERPCASGCALARRRLATNPVAH